MTKYSDELIEMVNANYEKNKYVKFEEQRAIRHEKRLSDQKRRDIIKKAIAISLVPVFTASGLIYANNQMSHDDKLDNGGKTKTEQQYDENKAVEEVNYDDYVEYTQVTGEPMSQEGAKEFEDKYDKDSFKQLIDEYQENGLSEDNSYRSGR